MILRGAAAALVVVALGSLGSVAAAQSERYPPEPADADKEAEEHSDFWERALEPGRGRYDELLARSRRLLDARTPKELKQASDLLTTAIGLVPGAPDAYYLRGWAREQLEDWAGCATDYQATRDRNPRFKPAPNPRNRGDLADGLGVCLARAGRYEEAATTLAQVTAAGDTDATVWIRLGEVYMALGRLDESIAALDRAVDKALEKPRGNEIATARWWRALALDRARRPPAALDAGDDITEAQAALRADPTLSRILNPTVPSAPPEDIHYLAGLAYDARREGERALLYYREFLRQGLKNMWRKRAQEHVARLRKLDVTEMMSRPTVVQGTSALTPAQLAKALRKDVTALGKCMKGAPQAVAEVRIVVVGPPAPPPKKGAPIVVSSRPPPAGATAKLVQQVGTPATSKVVDVALECLNRAGAKLKPPKLARGTWLQLTLPVISR